MNQTQLNKILEEHKKWLDVNGVDGEKADLRGADLYGANLCEADLRGADLYGANLCEADLRGANLYEANLCEADLCEADLDYSCFPLWCGGLGVHIDDKQAIQLLYHLTSNVLFSKNTSEDVKGIFRSQTLIDLANKFHRVNECGEIEGS